MILFKIVYGSINSKEKKLEILINNFMNKIDSDSLDS